MSRKLNFKSKILKLTIKNKVKNIPSHGISEMCLKYYRRYEEFRSDLVLFKKNEMRTKFLMISVNIYSTKKADHILEIPGLKEYCVSRIIHKKS